MKREKLKRKEKKENKGSQKESEFDCVDKWAPKKGRKITEFFLS